MGPAPLTDDPWGVAPVLGPAPPKPEGELPPSDEEPPSEEELPPLPPENASAVLPPQAAKRSPQPRTLTLKTRIAGRYMRCGSDGAPCTIRTCDPCLRRALEPVDF